MKRTIPYWLFLFLTGIAIFFTYVGFLYVHCSTTTEQLITLQGEPSSLSGLKLSYSEILSPYGDYLSSDVLLGDQLSSKRTFHSKVLEMADDAPIPSRYDYHFPILQVDSFFNKENPSPTLPCKILTPNTSSMEEFPYLTIKTPNDYMEHEEDTEEDSPFSDYCISIHSSHYVTLGKKNYFFISSVTATKGARNVPLSYTIHGGLFLHNKKSVECVYDFTATDSNHQKVLALFLLNDQNHLGLIIQTGNSCSLQIIDPNTKQAVASYPLPLETKENSEDKLYARYNSSNHTLILNNDSTLLCYQLSNPFSLQQLASYNLKDIVALQKNKNISLSSGGDYLYSDNILYMVTYPQYEETEHLPYLLAFQPNKIVYEGYLSMDMKEDYAPTRQKRIPQTNMDEDMDALEDDNFHRTIAQIQLSLAK